MSYEKELQIAIEACLQAAKLCEYVRLDLPQAMEKSDQSPVTLADFGSQAMICHRIRTAFPDDPIVAEENPRELLKPERQKSLEQIRDYVRRDFPTVDEKTLVEWISYGNGQVAQRYWTLDPIDGTKGFLRQDQYAVALALIVDGDVKVGVLACPALGNDGALFYAVRGQGAFSQPIRSFENSSPNRIRTITDTKVDRYRFTESVESQHGDQNKQKEIAHRIGIVHPPMRVDSQAKYGLVASGEAVLYLRLPNPQRKDYRENIWDHAAGAIIVEEAGGKVTDMDGKALNFRDHEKMLDNRGVVVSNGAIHQQVLDVLKE